MTPPSRPIARPAESGDQRPNLRVVAGPAPRTLVLIPCLNEGPRIAGIIGQLHALYPNFDVLVVDDGSTDDTAAAAEEAGADVIRLPLHLGYGAALQTGYRYALEQGYEQLVQMDGDGQHPPEELAGLVARLSQGCLLYTSDAADE